MRPCTLLIFALLVHHSVSALSPAKRHYDTHDYYLLEHNPDILSGASLDDIAAALGVEVVEQAGELQNFWLVRTEKPATALASRTDPPETDRVLATFKSLRVQAGSDQFSSRSIETLRARSIVQSVKYLSRQTLRRREKRAPPADRPPIRAESSSRAVAERLGIKDPLFPDQWHIVNDDYPEHMMNVTPVWEMGITGHGVISALIDDGLDYTNRDLAPNFYAAGSYDFNDHTALPTPVGALDHHGTRCAGQIAAIRNDMCGVGMAYDSKVSGLRILSGPISDVDESAALNYDFHNISIYSCSWGPPDNGKAMEGPNYVIQKAVINGINRGRKGLGSVFVFASGNGAHHGDQCNFDGYTNSIYSVTVSAVDYKGLHPYYAEACAANMIVGYSSGSGKRISTTDRGVDQCTNSHGGTSAAAPNVVAVIALALQIRPDLSWRDVQYLCIVSARMINPEDPDWETTATGRRYSYKYGYGAMDAYAFVTAAKEWKTVKPQAWFETPGVQLDGGTMDDEENIMSGGAAIVPGGVNSTLLVTEEMKKAHNFETLEHINVKVWISHTRRGDVEVEVVSPKGVKSVLAGARSQDDDEDGYPGWKFMSVKHWGEDPVGQWIIRVRDQNNENESGSFLGWNMIFWGSAIDSSKAKKFELPLLDDTFPPAPPGTEEYEDDTPSTTSSAPSATKSFTSPTHHLPGDHGEQEGENHKPTFSSDTANGTPTPDEGWFSDMSDLVSGRKWFFGAVGAVALFGIGAAVFFWRRRQAQIAEYVSIPEGEDMPMIAVGAGRSNTGPPRTKELYDAFGEVSDEDDGVGGSNPRGGDPQGRSPQARLGFHSAFLDDDDPLSTSGPTTSYRDDPDEPERLPEPVERRLVDERVVSPSGSGDGSWEHASATK